MLSRLYFKFLVWMNSRRDRRIIDLAFSLDRFVILMHMREGKEALTPTIDEAEKFLHQYVVPFILIGFYQVTTFSVTNPFTPAEPDNVTIPPMQKFMRWYDVTKIEIYAKDEPTFKYLENVLTVLIDKEFTKKQIAAERLKHESN